MAGYDGVGKLGFPTRDHDQQVKILQLAQAANMITIAQHYDADGETTPEAYTKSYYRSSFISLAFLTNPLFINTTNRLKTILRFEENAAILEKAFAIEKETGVKNHS